ncbi:MAG: adenosylcobinamide-GDP ribazoletransferase [Rhodospirillales bacterium]|nr:adenosylcobinamide-GDP ribazoletransferase [Rhodospirillales bacterium]
MPSGPEFQEFAKRQLSGWWHDMAVAGGFLTRLPFPVPAGAGRKGALAQASRAFPLVGLVVGAAGAVAMLAAAGLGLSQLACAFLGLALMALITGALHEDGLADVADGFGGGATPAAKIKIMRDSRTGVYGMLAVVFSVGLRAGVLGGFGKPEIAAAALVAAACLSRGLLPVAMHFLDPASKSGLARNAGRPDQEAWVTALVLGGLFAFLFLGPLGGLVAIMFGVIGAAMVAWLAFSQIGGVTGDVLGAQQQVAEVAILIAAAAVAS